MTRPANPHECYARDGQNLPCTSPSLSSVLWFPLGPLVVPYSCWKSIMLFQGPSKRWIEARASGCDPFRVVTATAARAPTHRRRAHEQIDASCIFGLATRVAQLTQGEKFISILNQILHTTTINSYV